MWLGGGADALAQPGIVVQCAGDLWASVLALQQRGMQCWMITGDSRCGDTWWGCSAACDGCAVCGMLSGHVQARHAVLDDHRRQQAGCNGGRVAQPGISVLYAQYLQVACSAG